MGPEIETFLGPEMDILGSTLFNRQEVDSVGTTGIFHLIILNTGSAPFVVRISAGVRSDMQYTYLNFLLKPAKKIKSYTACCI